MAIKIDANWLNKHEWMLRSSNNGISHNGFKWPRKRQWIKAPDWNDNAECGGGFHGNAPEASGYGFDYCRLELVQTRGKRVCIDGNKIKVPEAKIVAFKNEIPAMAFHRCRYKVKTVKCGTISPKCGEIYFICKRASVINQTGGYVFVEKNAHITITNQSGGYCWAYNGGTVNATNQSGGDCRAYNGGTVNATNQSGGYCRAYNGGTVNNK